jgi:hypothetical protein
LAAITNSLYYKELEEPSENRRLFTIQEKGLLGRALTFIRAEGGVIPKNPLTRGSFRVFLKVFNP